MKRLLKICGMFIFLIANSAHAQWERLNPTTFPFGLSDVHIFPDGSAYLVSDDSPYLLRAQDINDLDSGGVTKTFHWLETLRLSRIFCANSKVCFGVGEEYLGQTGKLYRSLDSGKTWQRLTDFKDYIFNMYFVHAGLWILQDVNGLHLSTDGGMTWQGQGYADLQYYDDDGHVAYFASTSSGDVYTVAPNGVSLYGQPHQLVPQVNQVAAFFPVSYGHLMVADSGDIYTLDSNYNASLVQSMSLPHQHWVLNKFGDTIVMMGMAKCWYSTDEGLTWQEQSYPSSMGDQFWYNYLPLGRYGNYFYFNETTYNTYGNYYRYDFVQNQWKLISGNQHPGTGMLVDMKNGKYFSPGTDLLPDTSFKAHQFDSMGKLLHSNLSIPVANTYQVSFGDSLHGVSSGSYWNNESFTTSDGGLSWQPLDLKAILGANQVEMKRYQYSEDGQCLFARGEIDGQNHRLVVFDSQWNVIAQGGGHINHQYYFENCDTGYFYAPQGSQLRYTEDGMATRNTVLDVGWNKILHLRVEPQRLAVLTSGGLYYGPRPHGNFEDKAFNVPTYHVPYLVTEKLEILYFKPATHQLMYSADTGQTFHALPLVVGKLTKLHAVDSSTILAVGVDGQIYRLHQVDQVPLGGENPEITGPNSIVFFPNPAREWLRIEFADARSHRVQIFDLQGRLIREETFDRLHARIRLSDMPAGQYLCRVQAANRAGQQFRFLKL